MADKKFGVKQINLIGASGTPTLTSPNNLNINAINVAISTDLSVGGDVSIGGTFNALSVSGVSTFAGNVGVGLTTDSVAYELDVAGYTRIRDGLIVNGGSTFPVELSADVFVYGYSIDISGGGLTVSGTTDTGVCTATSLYGDASRAVSGKWTLGANGSSNYTFDGVGVNAGNNYNTPMYLARGCVYEFVNNSGGSHPFQIRVSNGGAAYSTGVTNNGASSGTIRFEVPMDAPNSLYYQCTSHSGMGGTITVYPDAVV